MTVEKMNGHENPVFTSDEYTYKPKESVNVLSIIASNGVSIDLEEKKKDPETEERDVWSNKVEFLMSCIALSVGLGNIWRFPFVALENGGGAFLIPYIIVLILIGKPTYFMEMAVGQFTSGNSVKVFNCAPIMKGVGMGQVIATIYVTTYYTSIMATTLRYLVDSFRPILPWSECKPEWGPCIPSRPSDDMNTTWSNDTRSSAELYYLNDVIRAKDSITDGIGSPIWNLVGYLIVSWIIISLILLKGVKSTGKASYVLAIFPYIIILVLLVRALTLPGSLDGIKFFFTPQWDKILEPSVWYAATTQVFFSLNTYFGSIVSYASYNKFDHNIYRDANIVTTLDTFTSLLSGCTIFGIIGHLAHEVGVKDISLVVKGGPGLAFISYPEAISKFKNIPQIYAILFFVMLYMLALGCIAAMTTCITTIVKDSFKWINNTQAVIGLAICGIITGSVYLTPGGQSLLKLVDFYGGTFIAIILAVGQLFAYCYFYGVTRLCKDIEFMLGFYPNLFWTTCWRFVTPGLMVAIVIYTLIHFELPRDGNTDFPVWAHIIGWCLTISGLIQVPIFAYHRISRRQGATLLEKVKLSLKPADRWGPRNEALFKKYKESLSKSH